MAAELLIWRVFPHGLQRHSDCCPEPFQRLLRAVIAQSPLNSPLKFESNGNFSICEQIVPDLIVGIQRRGGGLHNSLSFPLHIFWCVIWLGFTSISKAREWGGHRSCGPIPHAFSMPLRAWTLERILPGRHTNTLRYFILHQAHFPWRWGSWGKECAPSGVKVSCLYLSIFVALLLDNVFIYKRENLYA